MRFGGYLSDKIESLMAAIDAGARRCTGCRCLAICHASAACEFGELKAILAKVL